MPKIEVNEQVFHSLVGRKFSSRDEFEEALTAAKAELDEAADPKLPAEERTLKIELNDTNRPDLWSSSGIARQLRVHAGGKAPAYSFFSRPGDEKPAKRKVLVDKSVKGVRPYIAGFVASGKAVTDAALKDMIQTQEKLAWNFGRKRRTISMGLYRISIIKWPVSYKAVDPASVSFVPLQGDKALNLNQILAEHPKGKEYAFILEKEPVHPLLLDSAGAVLSYPPIINSADLGAVKVGDTDLFIELTGTDQPSVTLAASIIACDFADLGYTIEPVEVVYDYETPFGKRVVTPYYFQEPVFCSLAWVRRILGTDLSAKDCVAALGRMGCKAEAVTEKGEEGVKLFPPEYRNDFLHAVDVVEDVMIGRGMNSFAPETPKDFTVGRLTDAELFARKAQTVLVGLGFQEMIFNYLGSRRDFVEKMNIAGDDILQIANPMSENFEYVRNSVLPCLLQSESVSGNAVYPHQVYEIGKIVRLDKEDNYGSVSSNRLGFLTASAETGFNQVNSQIAVILYYLGADYKLDELDDPRFIPGRGARILVGGKAAGFFGEVHPAVLANWNIQMPCTAGEIDLDSLRSIR